MGLDEYELQINDKKGLTSDISADKPLEANKNKCLTKIYFNE